jgi:hypothetical protein
MRLAKIPSLEDRILLQIEKEGTIRFRVSEPGYDVNEQKPKTRRTITGE